MSIHLSTANYITFILNDEVVFRNTYDLELIEIKPEPDQLEDKILPHAITGMKKENWGMVPVKRCM